MIHARADYQRIQDPEGKIGDDEPVFLLRAQDRSAPDAVRQWAFIHSRNGGDREVARIAMDQADRMEEWQQQHGAKTADMPLPPQEASRR